MRVGGGVEIIGREEICGVTGDGAGDVIAGVFGRPKSRREGAGWVDVIERGALCAVGEPGSGVTRGGTSGVESPKERRVAGSIDRGAGAGVVGRTGVGVGVLLICGREMTRGDSGAGVGVGVLFICGREIIRGVVCAGAGDAVIGLGAPLVGAGVDVIGDGVEVMGGGVPVTCRETIGERIGVRVLGSAVCGCGAAVGAGRPVRAEGRLATCVREARASRVGRARPAGSTVTGCGAAAAMPLAVVEGSVVTPGRAPDWNGRESVLGFRFGTIELEALTAEGGGAGV